MKFFLGLLFTVVFFAMVFISQNRPAHAAEAEVPVDTESTSTAVDLPEEVKTDDGWSWGFCYNKTSCKELAARLASDLEEQSIALDNRQHELNEMEATIKSEFEQSAVIREEAEAKRRLAEQAAQALRQCVAEAAEVLDGPQPAG